MLPTSRGLRFGRPLFAEPGAAPAGEISPATLRSVREADATISPGEWAYAPVVAVPADPPLVPLGQQRPTQANQRPASNSPPSRRSAARYPAFFPCLMEDHILGLHHLTAIAGDARRNYTFYTQVLGLRFLKKTVNFDDPGTYHLYFGDETGSAGTILTFFPWGSSVTAGRPGTGQATAIGYAVPAGSLDFWQRRFTAHGVVHEPPGERFGEQYVAFHDPDGLALELIVSKTPDPRVPWTTPEVGPDVALRGFHAVTLTLASRAGTAQVLTAIFGYTLLKQAGNRFRYATDAVGTANLIDLVEDPGEHEGHVGGGSVHHVAFRVTDDATLLRFREKVAQQGLSITPQIDRQYFHSLYFREPGGVLFEIATDNPGFMVDEPLAELGTHLLLPPQYEGRRAQLEARLPVLT